MFIPFSVEPGTTTNMLNQPFPSLSPAQRLVAEGRILAGFLTEATAAVVPEFSRAPAQLQNAIRSRFSAGGSPSGASSDPIFRHIDEPEVLALLGPAASACGGQTALSNLVGFEWVQIDTLLAGHYVAAPMPPQGRSPTNSAPLSHIARYCIVGSQVGGSDIVVLDPGHLLSPERLRLGLTGINLGPEGLTVQYSVGQEPSPVAVLLVDNRAFAVQHQERLVALLEGGVKEALCLVFYGYGTEALKHLPTIDEALRSSGRPPCIADFLSESATVRIPVHPPRTLLRVSHDAIDLNFS